MFRTNAVALVIWQNCNKPIQLGLSGAVPTGVETVEIESVCGVHKTELTPDLLRRIRRLDNAYRDAVVRDMKKKNG